MKKAILASVVLMLFATSAPAEEWFDMAECEICKPMASNMHLMSAIKWETHMLPNGFLSITVIPAEHEKTMEKAHHEMEHAIKRAQDGEEMKLCGHCQSWGELMDMGANRQELDTVGGKITLLTSDDGEVVKKIQAHAQKSLDEFKKMMEATPAS